MGEPKCFKCTAKVSCLKVFECPTEWGTLLVMYCEKCGAVQGVTKE
ncbi:hypothetical protein KAI12_01985 [Candidatus Bathyarchaeota archaeon]|nr:hypothetical protein [Candidatus Bathyarchaeota archaeon]